MAFSPKPGGIPCTSTMVCVGWDCMGLPAAAAAVAAGLSLVLAMSWELMTRGCRPEDEAVEGCCDG